MRLCYVGIWTLVQRQAAASPFLPQSSLLFSRNKGNNAACWKRISRGGSDVTDASSEAISEAAVPDVGSVDASESSFALPSAAFEPPVAEVQVPVETIEIVTTSEVADHHAVHHHEPPAKLVTSDNLVVAALQGLCHHMKGPKTDTLLLLAATAFNPPLCKRIGLSPILGFLALGIVFGPNGRGLIKDIHTTEMLAEIGIVFFLFEMGIHLSFSTLTKMRTTVFGLGGFQFAITALVVAATALKAGLSTAAAVVLGGGLALSSSAFVLQLLKDKNELSTVYGKNSFGVLLLQDLMVVPLLVIMPILAGTGGGVKKAVTSALIQLTLALTIIGLIGKYAMAPVFDMVVNATSQEALVALIMLTVLGMSFLTEGLGLSNTLGPFLAGVLLAENKHVHRIEHEASPIRGILVGLFFTTVGFEIDLNLIKAKFGLISSLVGGLLLLKTLIAGSVAKAFGLDTPTSRRLGLVLSQGGEFAFVAFRMARSLGILDNDLTKLMLTVVSLSMGFTPILEDLGASMMPSRTTVIPAKNVVVTYFRHFSKKLGFIHH